MIDERVDAPDVLTSRTTLRRRSSWIASSNETAVAVQTTVVTRIVLPVSAVMGIPPVNARGEPTLSVHRTLHRAERSGRSTRTSHRDIRGPRRYVHVVLPVGLRTRRGGAEAPPLINSPNGRRQLNGQPCSFAAARRFFAVSKSPDATAA